MKGMAILETVESNRAKETFYPTPEAVADKLLEGIDWKFVQYVLEPSAGKGDLAHAVVNKMHANNYWRNDLKSRVDKIKACDIDCVEIDPALRQMLEGQGFRVVHDNFLSFETQKRYDLIVMNPPFDQGEKHLWKALDLVRRGGKVRCILNAETIRNPFSEARKTLLRELDANGATIQYLTGAFAKAERKTDVDIAIVSVDIPAVTLDSRIMDDMRKAPTYKQPEISPEYAEVVRYNAIDEWVNRYNYEVACGIKLMEEYEAMKRCMPEETSLNGASILNLTVHVYGGSSKEYGATVNAYIREVRGKYWRAIFQQPAFTKKLTYNLLQELQDHVRELMDYDFSAYNILTLLIKMNQKVIGGIEQTIMKLFDDWTGKYHWSDTTSNRHYYDGWKTNDCFRVGKKVVLPFYGSYDDWSHKFRSFNVLQKFIDIEKVFDFLDCGRTEWEGTVEAAFKKAEEDQNTKNIDTKYFTVTFFKKGTAHFVFKDEDLLEKFNLFAGRQKGWLPPSYGKKRYKDMTPAEKHVVDSFQGRDKYEEIMNNAAYYLDAGQKQPLLIGG